jgi:poly-beta-1,6-N-acetyl-D-glucosamine synthase
MSDIRYVVITPVRDEEEFLPTTIKSMCTQTVLPYRWILVNDGSRDRTANIVEEAAVRNRWILPVHRGDRGSRAAGSGVIEAFYDGYRRVEAEDWDFIAKFDADLSFPPDYFERCIHEFAIDPNLGIAGGTCSKLQNGKLVAEYTNEPKFHVRGPTKIYRRDCFRAIGGLLRAPGWDTVDQLKANMLGWKTRTFPNVRLHHLRPTGGAYGSWNDWVKNGLANYITGYDPLFMACKCIRRTFRKPHANNGAGLWLGFLKGYARRISQVKDPELIAFVRREQRRALFFRPSLWS